METCIALVAINHSIFVVTFSAEADFAVSLKKVFELLHFRDSLFPLVLLQTHFPYGGNFQCLFQHLISFVSMPLLKVQQNLIHPQLFPDFADFKGKVLFNWSGLDNFLSPLEHLLPVVPVPFVHLLYLLLPEEDLTVDLVVLPAC